MRARQNAVLAALLRAQRFIEEYLSQLTSDVDFTAARKRLDDIVASFTTHAVVQNASDRDVKGESAKQQQLRVTLSAEVMRPIAEIARQNLRSVPEFKALRMPPQAAAGPAFLASAQGMMQAATIHKETLSERGLPADHLDQFQAGLTSLETSVSEREKSRTRRMGAAKGLLFEEKEGRSILKVLDAMVRRAANGNAALLGTWQGARAIHRRPGSAATTPTTESSSPAAPAGQPASTSTTPVAAAA